MDSPATTTLEPPQKAHPQTPHTSALGPGKQAPEFNLNTTPDQTVKLSELRGCPVILVFYPADWSPVCSDEMALFNECLPEFQRYNAELLGISVDGYWCHMAFSKHRKIRFPLLSDFEPKGETARAYGVYNTKNGICERALFLIDKDGIVRWNFVSPMGINPGVNGILTALDNLAARGTTRSRFERFKRFKGAQTMISDELYQPRLTIDVSDEDHIAGDPDAPVTLLEYGDYECPFCGMAHRVVQTLQKTLGGQMRFVFRNFPLRVAHPHAENAAETAEAAATVGSFWPMHDLLFENQDRLEDMYLLQYGAQLGLDPRRLKHDLATHRFHPRVQRDVISGMRSGVNGTPTFFINGIRHNGDFQFPTLLHAIEEVMQMAP